MNSILRKLPYKPYSRLFIIGDLHGRLDLLKEEMRKVNFNPQVDRLMGVGDLIDRGDESKECLELIYEPYFYSIRGNHEGMMIDSVLHNDMGSYQCWMANGGIWALDYVMTAEDWQEDFKDLVADARSHLPLAYEIEMPYGGYVGVIHAQPPNMWCEEHIKRGRLAVLWSRDLWDSEVELEVKGIEHVYVGHTPVKEGPITRGNITYLDTGANWTGNLTMKQIY